MPALDLAALPPVVVVPGIATWLGYPPADEPTDEPIDEWEQLLSRLSEAAS